MKKKARIVLGIVILTLITNIIMPVIETGKETLEDKADSVKEFELSDITEKTKAVVDTVSEMSIKNTAGKITDGITGGISSTLDELKIRTSMDNMEILDVSGVNIPEYAGEPVVELNGNRPFFSFDQFNMSDFEIYSELDSLGRCGQAYAKITKKTMPVEERGEIGHIKPSGWQTAKYDKSVIPDMYLYNRCHLIAFCLAGENDNPQNLITGTRYMNLNMLPYEMAVKEYIDNNPAQKVLYRVTPVYSGDNLVADGVIIEAECCRGYDISFCVFVYNVQPGVGINYANGDNWLE